MSNQNMPNQNDALNEYFKLKSKFESEMSAYKKRILNNQGLSKREKRAEFLKLTPKCVNCKRPSKKGTLFSTVYNPDTDTTSSYRKLTALCGDLADPCNLDIEIHIGTVEPLDILMHNIRTEIKTYKNKIIDDKNKLLFGLLTTEKALENFDFNKGYINDLTSVYEMYLEQWNNTIENPTKKAELDECLILSYDSINKIKECVKKMNDNNDPQFASDAANIYVTTLKPLLDKIRHLKYSENAVYSDGPYCKLIQKKYTELELSVSGYHTKIIKFNVGLQIKSNKKKKVNYAIEVDDDDENIVKKGGKELTIDIKEDNEDKENKEEGHPTNEIPEDDPIIGQGVDGIDWNLDEYKKLWSKLPIKLKTEFKLNIDWMKDYMHKCLNNVNGCRLTTPPNLVIPPRQMQNGQYDFGVSIYNKVFNKQPKTLQESYLTFYKEDPITKEKNYQMFENAINKLVENEVQLDTSFF